MMYDFVPPVTVSSNRSTGCIKNAELHILGPPKEACVKEDLPLRTKLKTRCRRGFDHNRKLSAQMGSDVLCNAWKIWMTVLT